MNRGLKDKVGIRTPYLMGTVTFTSPMNRGLKGCWVALGYTNSAVTFTSPMNRGLKASPARSDAKLS